MRKLFNIAAAVAAFGSAAAPALAQPTDFAAFDPARAQTVAERLVLCDMSAFLASRPDLDAQVIYVRRDDQRYDPLIPPFAGGGSAWYEDDHRRAYQRLRSAGQVTPQELAAAQDRYIRPMTKVYERATPSQQRTLESTRRFCKDFARSAGR